MGGDKGGRVLVRGGEAGTEALRVGLAGDKAGTALLRWGS